MKVASVPTSNTQNIAKWCISHSHFSCWTATSYTQHPALSARMEWNEWTNDDDFVHVSVLCCVCVWTWFWNKRIDVSPQILILFAIKMVKSYGERLKSFMWDATDAWLCETYTHTSILRAEGGRESGVNMDRLEPSNRQYGALHV